MTSKDFFSNQRKNWEYLIGASIAPKNMSSALANGELGVCGEAKLVDASPARASHFIADHQVFNLGDYTTYTGKKDGLEIIDGLVESFAAHVPMNFTLRVFDDNGWTNLYKADVIAVETDDSSAEDSLNPRQAVFVVEGWELVSSANLKRNEEEEKAKKAEKEFDEYEDDDSDSDVSLTETPKTDFQHFTDYLRKIRDDSYSKAMGKGGDGNWSSTFSQVTDSDGKTVVRHSINGGKEEVNTFDKNGKLIKESRGCNCGHGKKHGNCFCKRNEKRK